MPSPSTMYLTPSSLPSHTPLPLPVPPSFLPEKVTLPAQVARYKPIQRVTRFSFYTKFRMMEGDEAVSFGAGNTRTIYEY